MRYAAALLALALLRSPGEAADSAGTVAEKVRVAYRAGDTAALRVLGALYHPDPWIVAEYVGMRGDHEAAAAFAAATAGADTERLGAYVSTLRGQEDLEQRHRDLTAVARALRDKDPGAALRLLDALPAGGSGVLSAFRAYYRGLALRDSRSLKEAVPCFERAAALAQEIGWLRLASQSLFNVGLCMELRGDYRGALEPWRRKLELAEARRHLPDIATSLSNLGEMHARLQEFESALGYQQRAREAACESGALRQECEALGRLAHLALSIGDHGEARTWAERGLDIARQTKNRVMEGIHVAHLGTVQRRLGDAAAALKLHEEALEIFGTMWPREAQAVVGVRLDIVRDLLYLGRLADAMSQCDTVLRLSESVNLRTGVIDALTLLGVIHTYLGQHERRIELIERTIELGQRPTIARVNLADAYRKLGRDEEAVRLLETAIDELRRPEDRVSLAEALTLLGLTREALGRAEEAEAAYRQMGAIYEDLGMPMGCAEAGARMALLRYRARDYGAALDGWRACLDSGTALTRIDCLEGIAKVQMVRGRLAECAATAREGIGLLETVLEAHGDESSAAGHGAHHHIVAVGLEAARRLDDPQEALCFLEAGRGGALAESLVNRTALREAVLPADLIRGEAAAREREASAFRVYAGALRVNDPKRLEAARWGLDEARRARARLVERIQREAKRAASLLHPRAPKLGTLQKALAEDEAFVAYSLLPEDTVPPGNALALVVTHERARLVPLGLASAVRAAVAALKPVDEGFEAGPALERLRELLIAPLALGEDTSRLLLCPEGVLCHLPFAALLPSHAIAYLPSPSTWILLRQEAPVGGEGVLALGDADHTATRGPSALGRGLELRPLPGSAAEAKTVGTTVLLGERATEACLRDACAGRRWRAIHLACHGLLDGERPMLSALALTPSGHDDGLLTVLDVFRMKLSADLVVLSACETGRGKVVLGEGVLGFTRAFLFAGAPRAIVSLWKVDDAATQALMVKFYELWKDGGRSTAAALREAQEHVRKQEKWSHPYYWAAWQLWGLPD